MKVIYPDDHILTVEASEEDTNYLDDNLVNSYYLKKQWKATSSDAKLSFSIKSSFDLEDRDNTQANWQEGTLTEVEADSGGYLRLATSELSLEDVDGTALLTSNDEELITV